MKTVCKYSACMVVVPHPLIQIHISLNFNISLARQIKPVFIYLPIFRRLVKHDYHFHILVNRKLFQPVTYLCIRVKHISKYIWLIFFQLCHIHKRVIIFHITQKCRVAYLHNVFYSKAVFTYLMRKSVPYGYAVKSSQICGTYSFFFLSAFIWLSERRAVGNFLCIFIYKSKKIHLLIRSAQSNVPQLVRAYQKSPALLIQFIQLA